jgi:alkyldihydroxyacetonephosphate synthase
VSVATRRRKHWGWGFEDQQPSRSDLEAAAKGIRESLGFGGELAEPVPAEEVELAEPRLGAPDALAEILSDERHDRLCHALGAAYRDVVRGFRGEFPHPPDLVAHPGDESDLEAVLSFCEQAGAAAIPYGGGTSVTGGGGGGGPGAPPPGGVHLSARSELAARPHPAAPALRSGGRPSPCRGG